MDKKKLSAIHKILEEDGYKDFNILGTTATKKDGDSIIIISMMYSRADTYVPEYASVNIPMTRIKENM